MSETLDLPGSAESGWTGTAWTRILESMERSQRKASHLYLVTAGAEPRRERDEGLERVEQLMRAEPERRWTVAVLARRAGMSRAVFARKFAAAFGRSPLRYLTELRMERGAELLQGSDVVLAQVAERVGYGSEFAFNRAFKRWCAVPPGVYRRVARGGGEIRMAA